MNSLIWYVNISLNYESLYINMKLNCRKCLFLFLKGVSNFENKVTTQTNKILSIINNRNIDNYKKNKDKYWDIFRENEGDKREKGKQVKKKKNFSLKFWKYLKFLKYSDL